VSRPNYAPPPTGNPGTPEYRQQYADYLAYEQWKQQHGTEAPEAETADHKAQGSGGPATGYTFTAKVRLDSGRVVQVRVPNIDADDREAADAAGVQEVLHGAGGTTRSGTEIPSDRIMEVLEHRAARPRGATQPTGSGEQQQGQGQQHPQQGQHPAQQGQGQQQGQPSETMRNEQAGKALVEQAKQAAQQQQPSGPPDLVLLRQADAPLSGPDALAALAGISAEVVGAAIATLPASIQAMITAAIGQARLDLQTPLNNGQTLAQAIADAVAQAEPSTPPAPQPVEVVVRQIDRDGTDEKTTTVTNAHAALPEVLSRLQAGLTVTLVGPTGCGKTHLWYQAAQALGHAVHSISMTAGVQEWHLLGKREPDGNGGMQYVPAPFVTAFESDEPYMFLFDEFDSADPNVALVVNQALSNDRLPLPNRPERMAHRGNGFMVGVAMNTYGRGADRAYAGRNTLDAATRDRIMGVSVVEMDYDRALEASLVTGSGAKAYLARLWDLRDVVAQHKLEAFVSTRQICNGWRMITTQPQQWNVDRVVASLTSDWTDGMRRKAGL
jgi:energy-coupling factor transporter ATP-binding protein EcfA2